MRLILLLLSVNLFMLQTLLAKSGDTCKLKTEVMFAEPGSNHYVPVEKELDRLYCFEGKAKYFENDFFKIVEGTSEETISVESNPEIVKRAANVFFHLMKARDFWVNEIGSDYVRSLDKLTIRVNIKNHYSKHAHFKSIEKHGENFNNAWTVDKGKTPSRAKVQKSWGYEVWFAPKKAIPTSEFMVSQGNNPMAQGLRALKQPILDETTDDIEREIIRRLIEGKEIIHSQNFQDMLIQNLIVHSALSVATMATDKMDLLFLEDEYLLDTALLPEVIYHEFSHIVLSDTFPLRYFTPVNEGMADYFATRIANHGQKMYKKIDDIATTTSKNPHCKDLYNPILERREMSDRDFVLCLIWKVKDELEQGNKDRKDSGFKKPLVSVDELVYNSRRYMHRDADIYKDLSNALIRACRKKCSNIMTGVSIIQRSLEKKNL